MHTNASWLTYPPFLDPPFHFAPKIKHMDCCDIPFLSTLICLYPILDSCNNELELYQGKNTLGCNTFQHMWNPYWC